MATKKPAPRKPTGAKASPDAFDRMHEALLLAAHGELADAIADEIHAVDGLNEKLAAQGPVWRKEIEARIQEGKISGDQIAVWRAVPTLQFGSTGLKKPHFEIGRTLYRRFDARGEVKKIPEPLSVIDFSVVVAIPDWHLGYLAEPDAKRPLASALDALRAFSARATDVRVLGLVLPSSVTLGHAIRQIETILEHGRLDAMRNNWEKHSRPPMIGVTDSPMLFEVLSEKVDMMLVENGEATFDLGYLRRLAKMD